MLLNSKAITLQMPAQWLFAPPVNVNFTYGKKESDI